MTTNHDHRCPMTRAEALHLIHLYCDILERDDEQDETLTGLRSRFPEDGSAQKAMRWLGFIQGALYVRGRFTLEDLKKHSKSRSVLP